MLFASGYCDFGKKAYLCTTLDNGRLAEWLGRGLQNLVQQFESATDLTQK